MCDSTAYLNYLSNHIYHPLNSNPNNVNSSSGNPISSSTGVFPSRTDFAGDLNFKIILNTDGMTKKKWLFSEKLKKVFIDINKNIGISFKWDAMDFNDVKFIRALPVYTQDDWLRIPVERCPMHKCYEDNMNIDFPWVNHVLRCDNEGTRYELDFESKRRSCITPVTLTNCKDVLPILYYKFVCKTSCYRGMQRRPVVVIFTLEDSQRNVLGRRCLSFKVCSCLKRDLYREENGTKKNAAKKNANIASHPSLTSALSTSDVHQIHGRHYVSNSEVAVKYSLKLTKLPPHHIEYSLKIIHNTLLGEVARNGPVGNEAIISQIEKYLKKISRT